MVGIDSATKLISALHIVHCESSEHAFLDELTSLTNPRIVNFVNAHAVNLCWTNGDVLAAFLAGDFLLRDGSGMKYLMKRLGMKSGVNMNGTDFIPKMLDRLKGRSIAVWGSQMPYVSQAGDLLRREGHRVVSIEHGFYSSGHYLDLYKQTKPDVLLLAMGMPKQEGLSVLIKSVLDRPCVIICGGAIVDFMVNRYPRAPAWVRRLGIEWLFRLGCEPKRLFKRYVIGNALFLLRSLALSRPQRQTQAVE